MLRALAVSGLLVWSLLAFGAVYPWASLPLALAILILALVSPPRLSGSPTFARLDRWLIVLLAAMAFQLVPLPQPLLARLSPNLADFEARYGLWTASVGESNRFHALSLDPMTTAYTLALTAAMVLLFWYCRSLFAQGGLRRVARTIAALGFLAALVAIVQRGLSGELIYGFWKPLDAGADPLGPAVNRNQFAGWLIVALPLAVGYLVAHLRTHRASGRTRAWGQRLARTLDSRVIWVAGSVLLMAVTVLLSRSRSAVFGLAVGSVVGWWVSPRHRDPRGRLVLVGLLILGVMAAQAWGNLDVLASRFDRVATAADDRAPIWRDTLAVARRFWLPGVGLGGYQAAMTVYQSPPRTVFYNHAHSQYFQLLAEGGVLLAFPALMAGLALAAAVRERLRADRSAAGALRAGAVAGLTAFAVQSLWECGLRMPANGVLLAVVAAIALHQPAADREAQG